MRRLWLSIVLAGWAGFAQAQQEQTPQLVGPRVTATSVLTVDVERLFTRSQFGEQVLASFNENAASLQAENRRISDALREEELALAAQRATMDPDAFRAAAEAFDEKAQTVRSTQDAKERELETFVTDGRDRFLQVINPILGELMVERGATAILDRRSVLLSLGSIDVTDAAIERIDNRIGDGTNNVDATDPTND